MGRKCVYKNCTNSKLHNPSLTFFSFPSKVEQRDIWIRNSGNVNLFHKIGRRGITLPRAWTICEQHFKRIHIRSEYSIEETLHSVPHGNRKKLVKHAIPFVYGKEVENLVENDSEDEFHFNLTTNLKTYPKNLNKTMAIKQEVEIDDTELSLVDFANTTNTTVHHKRIGGDQVSTKHFDMCGSTSQNLEQTSLKNDKANNEVLSDKIKTEEMDGVELDVTDASQGSEV